MVGCCKVAEEVCGDGADRLVGTDDSAVVKAPTGWLKLVDVV